MSRKSNSNRSGNGNLNYNRMSGGYQKNVYRQKLKDEGMGKAPAGVSEKKLRIGIIAGGIVWLALTIVLILNFKWIGLLIGVVIGAALVGGVYLFLRHKQNEIITYYKKLGMTEQMYIGELKKRGIDQKQLDAYRKAWRKVKVDSTIADDVNKKKKK